MPRSQRKLTLFKSDVGVLTKSKRIANELLNFLPPDHPDHVNAKKAYDALEKIIDAGPVFDLGPAAEPETETNGQTEQHKQPQTVGAK